jgi:hypothetical protein
MSNPTELGARHDHGWQAFKDDHQLHREWSLLKDEAFLNTVADNYIALRARIEKPDGRKIKPFCCHLWSAVSEELRKLQLAEFASGKRPIRSLDLGHAERMMETPR